MNQNLIRCYAYGGLAALTYLVIRGSINGVKRIREALREEENVVCITTLQK